MGHTPDSIRHVHFRKRTEPFITFSWTATGAGLIALISGLLPAWTSACSIDGSHMVIVSKGKAQALVVIPDDAQPTAKYAARELVAHITKATGVVLEIMEESIAPIDTMGKIYVGDTRQAKSLDIRVDHLASEEAVIRRRGDALFITGRDGPGDPLDGNNTYSGTLWGVYEYLERELGVRWLWPGELGTYVPARQELTIGAIDWRIKPAFLRRFVRHHSKSLDDTIPPLSFTAEELAAYRADLAVFMRRHRMGKSEGLFTPSPNGVRPYGHAFGRWWAKHGAEHPEWFQLVDGKRGPGGVNTSRGKYMSMCVSNPELHAKIIAYWKQIRAQGRAHPLLPGSGPHHINICESDDVGLCECDACRAWDGPQPAMKNIPAEYRGAYTPFNASNRYARFAREIYRRAAEIDPEVKVYAYAYLNYCVAPDPGLRLNENIIIGFCPWMLGNPSTGRSWWPLFAAGWLPRSASLQNWEEEQCRKWTESGASVFYRPNWFLTGYAMPHLFPGQIADLFRSMSRTRVIGTDIGGINPQWATQGSNLYTLMRLHAHPERMAQDILEEYYQAFGSASNHIEEYCDYWEEHCRRQFVENKIKQPGFGQYYLRGLDAYDAFPPECFDPAEKILQAALQAARRDQNSEFGERVLFLMKGLEHAKLCVEFAAVHGSEEYYQARTAALGTDSRRAILEMLSEFRRRMIKSGFVIADFTWNAFAEVRAIQGAGKRPDKDAQRTVNAGESR